MGELTPISEIMKRWLDPTPEDLEAERQRENSFRRGYHQGFDAAIDDIFDMLDAGMSRKDAYALAALHVNRLAVWRAVGEPGFLPPPAFVREQLLETLHKHHEKF